MKHVFKQNLYRLFGVLLIAIALFTSYRFGGELLPLAENTVKGQLDTFWLFLVLVSLFLGVPALLLAGIRSIFLRSYSRSWLYFLTLPIASLIHIRINVGLIADMDRTLSLSVLYFLIYVTLLSVFMYMHQRIYTPISHDALRHVHLEAPDRPKKILPVLLVTLGFLGVLASHPGPISHTLEMLFSPVPYAIEFLKSGL